MIAKFKDDVAVLSCSAYEIYKSSPIQTLLLITIISIDGLVPLLGIYALSQLVNAILVVKNTTYLLFSLGMWVFSFALPTLLASLLILQQSALSETLFHHLSSCLMKATNQIYDLNLFECETIHKDLSILKDNIANRPVNLVVTLAGIGSNIIAVVSIAITLLTITFISPLLAILLGVVFFIISAKSQSALWSGSLKRNRQSRMMSYIFSLTLDRQTIPEQRIYHADGFLIDKFEREYISVKIIMNKVRQYIAKLSFLSFLSVCAIGLLMAWDILRVTHNHGFGANKIVFLLQGILVIQLTTRSLSEQLGWLKGHLLFFQKYFEHLGRANSQAKESVAIEFPTEQGFVTEQITEIALENCTFGYGSNTPVFENINLNIKKGEVVAIVGLNGSGKTTLTRLLLGLFKSQTGGLLVNGQKVEDFGYKKYWNACVFVPQDYAKFHFTIQENVLLGEEQVTVQDEVIAVLGGDLWSKKSEQLGREFNGIDLSGGQWQKLALLRAVMRGGRSQIVIFDEPTSAIDPLVENQIYDLMEQLSESRIAVFVTHRMATASRASRILLINDGILIAEGTHQELYMSNAQYRRMYDSQAKRFFQESANFSKPC